MARDEAMRLIVLRGVEGRREYVLSGDELVVGRPGAAGAADIAIDAPDVLERHASLRRDGKSYRLDPMPGARVLVNRREFAGGLLHDGDQVAFGGALFQFWAGGLKGEPPRAYDAAEAGLRPPQSADASSPAARRSARGSRSRAGVVVLVIVALGAALVWLARRFLFRPVP